MTWGSHAGIGSGLGGHTFPPHHPSVQCHARSAKADPPNPLVFPPYQGGRVQTNGQPDQVELGSGFEGESSASSSSIIQGNDGTHLSGSHLDSPETKPSVRENGGTEQQLAKDRQCYLYGFVCRRLSRQVRPWCTVAIDSFLSLPDFSGLLLLIPELSGHRRTWRVSGLPFLSLVRLKLLAYYHCPLLGAHLLFHALERAAFVTNTLTSANGGPCQLHVTRLLFFLFTLWQCSLITINRSMFTTIITTLI